MSDEKVTSTPFRITSPSSGSLLGTTFPATGTVDWTIGGSVTATLTVPGHAPIPVQAQQAGRITWQADFANVPTGSGASIEATWSLGSPPWPTADNLTIS
jgi:hypothetical protein